MDAQLFEAMELGSLLVIGSIRAGRLSVSDILGDEGVLLASLGIDIAGAQSPDDALRRYFDVGS